MENKKIIAILIILLLLGVIPISGYSKISNNENNYQNTNNSLVESLDFFNTKIDLLMKIAHMPSLSACIIKEDKIIWYRGYGYYDGENIPNKDTSYLIASTTKSITATAVMQLYEKGYFELDDDVNNYLDFSLRNPHYPDIPITFRMLLAHQSSLSVVGMLKNKYVNGNSNNTESLPELGSYLKSLFLQNGSGYDISIWRDRKPGGKFEYANIGYILLGYLVECISNENFGIYCQKNIFEKLDMENTSFLVSKINNSNIAIPYIWYKISYPNVKKWVAQEHANGPIYPAGFLRSSISDLSHFLIAHMNKGVYNGVRILNKSTVDLMHTIQYPKNRNYLGAGKYGLGFFIKESLFKPTLISHGGDYIGCHSNMLYYPTEQIGIIYFTNRQLSKDLPGFIARILLKSWMTQQARKICE